jgi:hypothetical protein
MDKIKKINQLKETLNKNNINIHIKAKIQKMIDKLEFNNSTCTCYETTIIHIKSDNINNHDNVKDHNTIDYNSIDYNSIDYNSIDYNSIDSYDFVSINTIFHITE